MSKEESIGTLEKSILWSPYCDNFPQSLYQTELQIIPLTLAIEDSVGLSKKTDSLSHPDLSS